jgi:hypothetical protein
MTLEKYIVVREELSPRAEAFADRVAGNEFSQKKFKDRDE